MTAVQEREALITLTEDQQIAAVLAETKQAKKDLREFRSAVRELVAREKQQNGWCSEAWTILRRMDVSVPTCLSVATIYRPPAGSEPTLTFRATVDQHDAVTTARNTAYRKGYPYAEIEGIERKTDYDERVRRLAEQEAGRDRMRAEKR